MVNLAIQDNKQLRIKTVIDTKEQTLIIHPYAILTDPMKTQEYLVCYSHKQNESQHNKHLASFSMARLDRISILSKKSFISKADKRNVDLYITKHSAAFLYGGSQEIRVRLTDNGKRIFRQRITSRPMKDDFLSTDDIYVFSCSEYQAYIYFFSFGEDAEILAPDSLRKKLSIAYGNAAKKYSTPSALN